MSLIREQIGPTANYRGHQIVARHCGPDLLCYVDSAELPSFYIDVEAAHRAGMRYVDQIEKEQEKRA